MVGLKLLIMKPYRPSNGTEGMWFVDKYCMNCINCNPDPEGEKQCEILARAMGYSFDDEEYPKDWVYKGNEPICTSHKQWDWERLGNPDDPDNPNYIQPIDPNQITLF